MAPPAKKQRRLVLSSDDESPQTTELPATEVGTRLKHPNRSTTSTKRTKQTSNSESPESTTTIKRKASLNSTPTSSPEKRRSRKEDTVKSKSLHSFFPKASEEQRWSKKELQVEADQAEDGLEDIDDDSDDQLFNSFTGSDHTSYPLDRRKASAPLNKTSQASHFAGSKTHGTIPFQVSTSHKFATRPPINGNIRSGQRASRETADHRPWADRYAPQSLEELAVHKKKVNDVKAWLLDAFGHPHRPHLLVLKGPAGSGKTTTLSLLARGMSFQLVEWRNSTTSESGISASLVSHFDEFLGRGSRFGSLDLLGESSTDPQTHHVNMEKKAQRVLTIDDFPTTFTRSAAALHTFRSSLLAYLCTGLGAGGSLFSSSKSEASEAPPIVLIVSETLLSSATASMDSLTAHRLLGPEIVNHPCTHMIEFNPVAPTFVSKALDVVIKKEARTSKRRRIPGPKIMKLLSEMADLRSAVNSLEFLCVRGDETGDWGGTVAMNSKRSGQSNTSLTAKEQESIELITQRESTLGMFHAVGKVVYNKRDAPGGSSTTPTLPPDHLQHLHRPNISQVSVDDLMNETGTDISTFVSGLHENYVLSCTGPSFVDHLNHCIDYLSDSDLLDTDSRRSVTSYRAGIGSARPNISTGSTDLIRQNEINFDVAVRGLLFSLPYPVSRATHPNGKKSDSHKMFFPAALRLWKKTEEIEGAISVWRNRLESGHIVGSTPEPSRTAATTTTSSTSKPSGVASWPRNPFDPTLSRTDDGEAIAATPPRSMTSRNDLILQYLPYLARIRSKATSTATTSSVGDTGLNLVTQFDGIDPPNDVDDGEADDQRDESLADIGGGVGAHGNGLMMMGHQQVRGVVIGGGGGTVTASLPVTEKLYISDDDIEDD